MSSWKKPQNTPPSAKVDATWPCYCAGYLKLLLFLSIVCHLALLRQYPFSKSLFANDHAVAHANEPVPRAGRIFPRRLKVPRQKLQLSRRFARFDSEPGTVEFRTELRSVGEVYAISSPVCLFGSSARLIGNGSGPSAECLSWNGTKRHEPESCERIVDYTVKDGKSSGMTSMFSKKTMPMPAFARWHVGPLLVITVNGRDTNVCHITMRLLLASSYIAHAREGQLGKKGYVPSAVVLLAPKRVSKMLNPAVADAGSPDLYPFHAGLADLLFRRQGIPVYVGASIADVVRVGPLWRIRRRFKWSKKILSKLERLAPSVPVCFSSIIQTGSFANRFSLPDSQFQDRNGQKLSETDNLQTQSPLSSELPALRAKLFARKDPPPMRNKVVYVARDSNSRRAFNSRSEKALRRLLRRVCDELQAELVIAESGSNSADLKRANSFQGQALQFVDASVVLGIHGAGLTLAMFLPPEAGGIIEVLPPTFPQIFGNLANSLGISHDLVPIGTRSHPNANDLQLTRKNLADLRKALRRRIKEGLLRIAKKQRGTD